VHAEFWLGKKKVRYSIEGYDLTKYSNKMGNVRNGLIRNRKRKGGTL